MKSYSATLFLAIFVFSAPTKADLVISFSADGGTSFSDQLDVNIGTSLSVGVFVVDDQGGGILETDGLFGFGITAASSTTDFGMIVDAEINPVFDFDITENFTSSTIDWEDAVFGNTPPAGNSVHLGDFVFQAQMEGATSIEFRDIMPGTGSANGNWLAGDGVTLLDETIFGSGATGSYELVFQSHAIPEPSTIAISSIFGLLLLLRRQRLAS